MKKSLILFLIILGIFHSVTSSLAGTKPEILGFRLGMTLSEVLARAASLNLAVAQPGRRSIAGLPDSEYSPQVTLTNIGPQGSFMHEFSAPPTESRLVSALRRVDYEKHAPGEAPPVAAVKTALVEKFGRPTTVFVPTRNHERLTWLWATDGRLQTQGLGMECHSLSIYYLGARAGVGVTPNPKAEKLMNDGCALFLEVNIAATSAGVTRWMTQQAIDIAGAYRANIATHQAVQNAVRNQQKKDLQGAKQRKPAI